VTPASVRDLATTVCVLQVAGQSCCAISVGTMSSQEDPSLEHVGSDMAKVRSAFQPRFQPSWSTHETLRHSRNLPSQFSSHSVWPYLTSEIRGEKTASALESRLTDIESRIDQLLASMEDNEKKEHDSPADVPADREVVTPSRR
jgi:hypothetical protein